MLCPLARKTCNPVYFDGDREAGWTCAGLLTQKEKGEVGRDRCRLCFTSHYHSEPVELLFTPDEGLMFTEAIAAVVRKFLNSFPPYEEWVEDND